MKKDEKYNGWANKETWCVHLWLANDPGSDDEYRRIATSYADVHRAADAIEHRVRDDAPGLPDIPGMYSELMSKALSRVDWVEIAKAFREP